MPVTAQTEISRGNNGKEEEKLIVEFTNGALQQLKDLAHFYDSPSNDLSKIVQLGISMLELLRQKDQVGQKDSTIINDRNKQ